METKKEQTTEIQLAGVAQKFALACKDINALEIAENAEAAFKMAGIIPRIEAILTDDVMRTVFMPLMNRKVGFLTDRNGRPNKAGEVKPTYSVAIVRDAIIDAITNGLLPTGNQFNIIAERFYPTKEGYTSLLKKINVKYLLNIGIDKATNPAYAEIPVVVNYEHNGKKNQFTIIATVKKDSYSSADQLRGKAERRAKKTLWEFITGCDLSDADEDSSEQIPDAVIIPADAKITRKEVEGEIPTAPKKSAVQAEMFPKK